MKKKFAFVMMGSGYNPTQHQVCFELDDLLSYVYTVRDFDEARTLVAQLEEDGVGAMELCGAFSKAQALELMTLSHNRIATGFMTHTPQHDVMFNRFFSTE